MTKADNYFPWLDIRNGSYIRCTYRCLHVRSHNPRVCIKVYRTDGDFYYGEKRSFYEQDETVRAWTSSGFISQNYFSVHLYILLSISRQLGSYLFVICTNAIHFKFDVHVKLNLKFCLLLFRPKICSSLIGQSVKITIT